VGNAEATLPVKLKGTQKRMAGAAVGTKSLGTLFAAARAASDKKKANSSDVPPSIEEQ